MKCPKCGAEGLERFTVILKSETIMCCIQCRHKVIAADLDSIHFTIDEADTINFEDLPSWRPMKFTWSDRPESVTPAWTPATDPLRPLIVHEWRSPFFFDDGFQRDLDRLDSIIQNVLRQREKLEGKGGT